VKILSDVNRNVTDSYNYDAFGNITNDTDPTPNPMRYVGQLGYYRHSGPATPRPPEYSGRNAFANCYGGRECLMLLGARWYDPTLGRFITQDSLGHAGAVNPHSHASGIPPTLHT
jgi:RHS repeat-associated protein